MKISLINKAKVFTTGLLVVAATVLAAQTPVNALTAKLAVENQVTDLNSMVGKITSELNRQSTEIGKTQTALNGDTKSGSAGKDAKECAEGDPKAKQAIDKTNNSMATANTDISKLLNEAKQAKTLDEAKKTAAATDAKYDQYKTANAQGNLMNTTCTQKEAQKQLEDMVGKAMERFKQCFGKEVSLEGVDKDQASTSLPGLSDELKTSASAEGTDSTAGTDTDSTAATASEECSPTGAAGGSGGGGGGGMDINEIIQKVIKILIMVSALIASIIALIAALAAGDVAGAAVLMTAIMGQLTMIAQMLLGGSEDTGEAMSGMGVESGSES